jgi:hypothetical protein
MEYPNLTKLAKVSDLIENQKLNYLPKINLSMEKDEFENLLNEVKSFYKIEEFYNKKEIKLNIGIVEYIINKNNA